MKVTIRFKIFYVLLFGCVLGFQHQFMFGQLDDSERNKIRTVVIDPGHGGKDSGALGKNAKEKDVVLAISLKLGNYIQEKFPDVKIIYTRSTDVFIPLHERAKIANDAHADLFISIHANSNKNTHATGTETFVMGLHKSNENLEVAKKENSVITFEENYKTKYEGFDPNDVESYIMISLIQDTYLNQSLSAASLIQDQFRDRAMRKDRGVKQAGFLVLWQTSMPSILVETGFISNPDEEAYLSSETGQDHLASAIFRAFRDYKNQIEGTTAPLAVEAGTKPAASNTTITAKPQATIPLVETTTAVAATTSVAVITNQPEAKDSAGSASTNQAKTNDNTTTITKFKVQILNSTKPIALENELFRDFNDVEEIRVDGRYKYLVGNYLKYVEAVEYSKWVKSRYPDAFIVAVSDGKIVPLTPEMLKTN